MLCSDHHLAKQTLYYISLLNQFNKTFNASQLERNWQMMRAHHFKLQWASWERIGTLYIVFLWYKQINISIWHLHVVEHCGSHHIVRKFIMFFFLASCCVRWNLMIFVYTSQPAISAIYCSFHRQAFNFKPYFVHPTAIIQSHELFFCYFRSIVSLSHLTL